MKLYKQIKIPLYYKIMLGFLALLLGLLIVVSFSGRIAQENMRAYFDRRMETKIEEVVDDIEQDIADNGWTIEEEAFKKSLEATSHDRSFRYEVLDSEGNVIVQEEDKWKKAKDSKQTYEGPDIKGINPRLVEKEIPIIIDDETVGYIKMTYFNVAMMNPDDIILVEAMSNLFVYMLMGTFLVCIIMSFFIARGITNPIKVVGATANDISEGNLKARAYVKTNTKELLELSQDINLLARKLEQEDLLRSQVTSDMAHEIRTPLTSLRNFFEAFIDGVYEVNEENLNQCHSEIVRMSDLIDRLKDIANIEAMAITGKPQMTDLASEITCICEFSRPAFDKKGIELKCELEDNCLMEIDPNHFRQTITNLVSNSLRYTDEGGKVTISIHKKAQNIVIQVADTGVGISPEDINSIFERFYRADKSRDRATGGIGVGLTIVKKMTELYGGLVSVESVVDQGSVFTITYNLSQ